LTDRARSFYRSPLTPVAFVVTGLFCSWSLSPWGPQRMTEAPSLQLLRHAMPFSLMAAAFLLYVVLILTGQIRAVILADCIGGVIYLSEFLALAWTSHDSSNIGNPILIAAVLLAVVLHALALRLAIFEKLLA
jgi:hypothetical protein